MSVSGLMDLRGKNAVVTGASRGIGAATATLLARAGANVLIVYRNRHDEAQAVATRCTEFGVQAHTLSADLSTQEGNQQMAKEILKLWKYVDIFVANSGVWPSDPVPHDTLDTQRWRSTLSLNLDGLFFGCRYLSPLLSEGGRIVIVSSTAGQRGEAFHSDYAASKGAAISFTKSLAVELAGRNITVNCVAPGWVDTDAVVLPFAGDGKARIESAIPLGRVALPEDIAGPIVFLCSSMARHVTGEILNVNGGSVLCG